MRAIISIMNEWVKGRFVNWEEDGLEERDPRVRHYLYH
jgi:hypothetical protein